MASQNSHLNYTNIDLEIEAIQRFRNLASIVPLDCHVYRELDRGFPILCLDFKACPQKLKMTKKQWFEFCRHLLYCSNYLGLSNSLIFQVGERIVGWISLDQTNRP
ncbi:MAG: hypothetical protein QNJ38_15450 [Prochloraceae cyanobacterium]|nr:hypothetical protein [Prochloraceae cyanobacterium]